MIDTNQLSALVSAFRVETEKESISPETVGKLLQDILDLLATASSDTERKIIDDWKALLSQYTVVYDVAHATGMADMEHMFLTLKGRSLRNGAALERYFRYEGKMSDNVVALPTFRTSLRLYCLRMSDSVLIVGNGGEKNTKTYEESAELNGYVISLQKLDELLKQEIASGSVVIEKANIVGADENLFDL